MACSDTPRCRCAGRCPTETGARSCSACRSRSTLGGWTPRPTTSPGRPDMGLIKTGIGWIASKILSPVADVAASGLNAVAKGIADAVGTVLKVLADAWIHLSTPDVWNGSTSAIVESLHSQVAYVAALLAVFGVMIGGIKLALQQRNEPGFDVVHGLLVLVLVAGMGVPTIGLLSSA